MKRTLSWLLCGTMILGLLIGCGNNNDTQSSEGSSNDTIKIGYFGPLTGGSAQLGQAALNGAQLAVNQLNEKGGILGCQVEIVSYHFLRCADCCSIRHASWYFESESGLRGG